MNNYGQQYKILNAKIELQLIEDILQFHNKGNLLMDECFVSSLKFHDLSYENFQSLERHEFEISPFNKDTIPLPEIKNDNRREVTARKFSDKKINFERVASLLTLSFGIEDKSRTYPSAGALYPVEIACAVLEGRLLNAPPCGFYHYRPTQNVLQSLRKVSLPTMKETLFHWDLSETSNPNFAFIYFITIPKMLIKYRHRGYRYALMEIGSMYQHADLMAKRLGLTNKLHSAFCDGELIKLLGLDNFTFMPIIIQSFGIPDEV